MPDIALGMWMVSKMLLLLGAINIFHQYYPSCLIKKKEAYKQKETILVAQVAALCLTTAALGVKCLSH